MNELEVFKSNHVIEASYRLTLSEQRLVLMCIQRIKKGQKVTAETPFEVTAADFADMFSISVDRAYVALQDVADKLYERSITIHQPDPEHPKLSKTTTRWISQKDYFDSEGKMRVYFSPKVIKYISLLEGNFTRYNLEHIAGMGSVYGIRFYELMKSWLFGDSKNTKKVEINDLKDILDLKDKKGNYQYPSIKDFKLYVLDKAMDDINEHSDLSASYETEKTGRKITHFNFSFGVKLKDQTKEKDQIKPSSELERKPRQRQKQKEDTTGEKEEIKRVIEDLLGMQNLAKMAGKPLAEMATPQQMEKYRKYNLI